MKPSFALSTVILLLFVSCAGRPEDTSGSDGTDGLSETAGLWYKAPPEGTHSRWASPENPNGEPGQGGKTNQGAKGNAFYTIAPGAQQVLLDFQGAGIITRMWMSGTIARNPEQRRMVRIDMFWDGAEKPAVSAPIGDFFGAGLGLMTPFDNELFSSPEGRSFNITIPMPFRTAARVVVTNESPCYVLFWYDLNLVTVKSHAADVMYFHTYWNRELSTRLGRDYEILPRVEGKGRYLGASIGGIGDEAYRGTWFGEGEVKGYLDGDRERPSLVGTGTEDYIGSGWGQGRYAGRYFGSLVSDSENDLYAFYRYHLVDPVYFHRDCRVTIQQMGNCSVRKFQEIQASGADVKLVALLDAKGADILRLKGPRPEYIRVLDMDAPPEMEGKDGAYFFRSDDVSAAAYFYLDQPQSKLPELPPVEHRMKDMQDKVWSREPM